MFRIPHGSYGNPFQGISDFFQGLEQLAMGLMALAILGAILLLVLVIVAGVGLGTITGMVFKKAVSEESGKDASGSSKGTSRLPGCLILLAGQFFGVGALLFAFFTAVVADGYGFNEDWFPPVIIVGMLAGVVFTTVYLFRRLRREGEKRTRGAFFIVGLLISSLFIGGVGSVSSSCLVYIALKKMEPVPLEQRLKSSLEIDDSGNIIAIRLDAETLSHLRRDWGELVSEELRSVRKIELSGVKVASEIFVHLQELAELEELYISSREVSNEVMPYLGKIKNLKRLTIEGNISDNGFKAFQQMGQLTDLDVGKTAGRDAGMQHLRNLTNLISLTVPQRVTGKGLVHLKHMQLKSLILPDAAKTDIGLKHYVAACEPQAQLDLTTWVGLQGPGLVSLREWPALKKLALTIEDDALPYVGQLAGISELSISESNVSDAAIEHLPRLRNLKRLNVSKTNISLQGLSRLRSALPNCEVSWAKLRSRIDRATYQSRHAALEFDGYKSYLSVGSFKYDGSYPLTAEAWVWPALERRGGAIMGNARQAGFTLSLDSDRVVHISFTGRGSTARVQSESAIPVRTWSHVAFVYDGDVVKLFVNGMQQNQSANVRREHHASRKRFMIGADPNYTNNPTHVFTGLIREVRLSKTARYEQSFTPDERFETDQAAIAIYRMDTIILKTVKNTVSDQHHASNNGATWIAGQPDDE